LSLPDAVAQSCNVYFFHFAAELGARPLVDWAQRFGFGRPTLIDLPDEAAGRLPTPADVRKLANRRWRLGDTQGLAIGQSSLTVTPLQMVRLLAAIANGGSLVTPHVVAGPNSATDGQSQSSPDNDIPNRFQPQRIAGLSEATLETVRAGLRRAVADPNGTAHSAMGALAISVAGKTGTAETGGGEESHAWFAGYVPADAPQLAFVVVLEHGGGGAAAAAPLARRLVERLQQLGYFRDPGAPQQVQPASYPAPAAPDDG
jgi:penicillin-binding protein 2